MNKQMQSLQNQLNDWCDSQNELIAKQLLSPNQSINQSVNQSVNPIDSIVVIQSKQPINPVNPSISDSSMNEARIAALEARILALEASKSPSINQPSTNINQSINQQLDENVQQKMDSFASEIKRMNQLIDEQKKSSLDAQLNLIELLEQHHESIQSLQRELKEIKGNQSNLQSTNPPSINQSIVQASLIDESLENRLKALEIAIPAQKSELLAAIEESTRNQSTSINASIAVPSQASSQSALSPSSSTESVQSISNPAQRSSLKKRVHFSEEFEGRLFVTADHEHEVEVDIDEEQSEIESTPAQSNSLHEYSDRKRHD